MSNIKQIILPNLESNENKKIINKRKIVNSELWETNVENIVLSVIK